MHGFVDVISEKRFPLKEILSMEMMRAHTKTNDIIQVTDPQLEYYREVAFEHAEIYTGRFIARLVSVREDIEVDHNTHGFRQSYNLKLSYTPLGGTVMLSAPGGGPRERVRTKKDDRIIKVPLLTKELTYNDCCRGCGGNMANRGYQAIYETGYRSVEDIPSGIVYGCLKFITWATANPGDELLTVRNRLGTTETGLIGTNNGAWASGAIEHWKLYSVRR